MLVGKKEIRDEMLKCISQLNSQNRNLLKNLDNFYENFMGASAFTYLDILRKNEIAFRTILNSKNVIRIGQALIDHLIKHFGEPQFYNLGIGVWDPTSSRFSLYQVELVAGKFSRFSPELHSITDSFGNQKQFEIYASLHIPFWLHADYAMDINLHLKNTPEAKDYIWTPESSAHYSPKKFYYRIASCYIHDVLLSNKDDDSKYVSNVVDSLMGTSPPRQPVPLSRPVLF